MDLQALIPSNRLYSGDIKLIKIGSLFFLTGAFLSAIVLFLDFSFDDFSAFSIIGPPLFLIASFYGLTGGKNYSKLVIILIIILILGSIALLGSLWYFVYIIVSCIKSTYYYHSRETFITTWATIMTIFYTAVIDFVCFVLIKAALRCKNHDSDLVKTVRN